MPEMKEARQNHSAIVQSGRLYVFGGRQNDLLLGSIEFLELLGGTEWTLIKNEQVIKRQSAAITQCGANQIAVFGGLSEANPKGKQYASEDYVFDTATHELKVINSGMKPLRFMSHTQTVKTGSNFATVGVVEEATHGIEERETRDTMQSMQVNTQQQR